MHPNGQIPAYEWALGDVNPPVHAWAALARLQDRPEARRARATAQFLEQVFHKLLLNFTWWVNRKDAEGKNVFEGGFLGLDNIGVFDRSRAAAHRRAPRAVRRHRWMAMYCLNMLAIALELAQRRPGLRGRGHQVLRALRLHRARHEQLGRRGIEPVGRGGRLLLRRAPPARRHPPIPAEGALHGRPHPALRGGDARARAGGQAAAASSAACSGSCDNRPDLADHVAVEVQRLDGKIRRLLSIVDPAASCRSVLRFMLDESEFLSPHGIRVAVPLPPRASLRLRRRTAMAAPGGLRARPSRRPGSSAATRTGGDRSGSR